MRISRLIPIVLLGLLAGSVVAQAPAKRPMTFDDMMHMRRLGGTDVSADGKWLLYSATDVDLAKNTKTSRLWVQAIGGGEPIALAGGAAGDDGARFSPDGKQILYVSGQDGAAAVWVADFDGKTGAASGNHRVVFYPGQAYAGVTAQQGRLNLDPDSPIWSPDGKQILFAAAVYPDCPAITPESAAGDKCNADRDAAKAESKVKARIFDHLLYRHWNAFTGDKRSHLFLADVAAGTVRDLTPNDPRDVPPFSLGGGLAYAFAPDGKELAFTENLDEEPAISTNADIFTLDLTSVAAKPVQVSTAKGGDFNPAYSPDGKWLAWRSQERAGYESDKFRLLVYDREKKTIKDLLPKFDNWVDEFVWGPDSKSLLFVSGEKGEEPLFRADLNGKLTKVSSQGEFSDLHPLSGEQGVIANRMSVDMPSEVYRITWSSSSETASFPVTVPGEPGIISAKIEATSVSQMSGITSLNVAEWMQLDLPKMESFWFEAADKTKVQGFLIRPPGFDTAKKYPVKFLIHGGPQGAWGDSWSYRWNAELFAANGYVVVMVNPRGSTGYGQAFVDGVNGDWGGKPYCDLMLGLDYAEKSYPFIDKTRECALGASYGGYMANWVLGHTDRFRCIVTHDGMYNPEGAYGETEELWFNEWEFKGKPWEYYGKPDSENPFRKWSPALYAKNFKTPTLVVHGQLDYRLDVAQGYDLFTTLQRLKVPSRMLYFPDEGHWVLKPQNSQLWWKTVNDWVDEWTKGSGASGVSGARPKAQ